MSAESFDDLEDTRGDAALQLAERGLDGFPVDAKSKRPDKLLALHGFKSATRDSQKIAGWFTVKPNCNIGIACGADYGLVVLDIDCRDGKRGFETFKRLEIDVLTPMANTPSHGVHLFCTSNTRLVLPATWTASRSKAPISWAGFGSSRPIPTNSSRALAHLMSESTLTPGRRA